MLLSTSNRKYPPFPLFSYFSVVVCLRCLLHHILSLTVYTFRENREFVFISTVQFMMSANSRIRFGLQIVFVCLYITPSHYHNCANFIWTNKMPVRYNLSCVWVRLSIFSQLSIICGAVCFQFNHFFCDDWENIYTLSYHHHQIGSMNYYPLFRARSWNNGMRCMSFYILMIGNEAVTMHERRLSMISKRVVFIYKYFWNFTEKLTRREFVKKSWLFSWMTIRFNL